MSLNPYALTTLERQKTFMKKTDTTDDTLLTILINVATDTIENHCGRRFKQTDYSNEKYDGPGRRSLLLKNFPVVLTNKTFQIDRRDGTVADDNWEAFDADDVFVDVNTGIVRFESQRHFDWGKLIYRATYTAGYAFENADTSSLVTLESIGLSDLELATWMTVKKLFNGIKVNGDIQSESIGDYSVTYRETAQQAILDPIIVSLLQKYIRGDYMI